MLEILPSGTTLQLQHSALRCTVQRFLGRGGQGEVYQVDVDEPRARHSYALKWYYPHTATSRQRAALADLIRQGMPSPRFLWPVDIADEEGVAGFGYVMPLRDPRYKGLSDLMNAAVSPSFRSLATAGLELADGFLQLHAAGYCYRDISFGNVFFRPDTGGVLICDNDNVGIEGHTELTISGTGGFMAPEVMRGESAPNIATDLFSLSVLLFSMFMVHHPFQGQREFDEPSPDDPAKFHHLYATRPVFIFDPHDDSNRPVEGVHDNALVYWPLYPQFLRDLFTRAFTEGLRDPVNGRVREGEWRLAMARLRDAIVYCGNCDAQAFWDHAVGRAPSCWRCGATVIPPFRLVLTGAFHDHDVVMLNRDTRLFAHHAGIRRYDFQMPVAAVSAHPTRPSVWGLKNLSTDTWVATTAEGHRADVPPDRSITLAVGTRIRLGAVEGVVAF